MHSVFTARVYTVADGNPTILELSALDGKPNYQRKESQCRSQIKIRVRNVIAPRNMQAIKGKNTEN